VTDTPIPSRHYNESGGSGGVSRVNKGLRELMSEEWARRHGEDPSLLVDALEEAIAAPKKPYRTFVSCPACRNRWRAEIQVKDHQLSIKAVETLLEQVLGRPGIDKQEDEERERITLKRLIVFQGAPDPDDREHVSLRQLRQRLDDQEMTIQRLRSLYAE
jgi:hypothetical protein